MHNYQDLINIFDSLFFKEYQTRLIKGEDEPIYLPKNEQISYSQIVFAHGFYASALHEISHWCIAGKERRELEDYGYWYCPDGRTEDEQLAFEKHEVRPQALDFLFCHAANFPFNVSADNLNGDFEPDRGAFLKKVLFEAENMIKNNQMPKRAKLFLDALHEFYQTKEIALDEIIKLR